MKRVSRRKFLRISEWFQRKRYFQNDKEEVHRWKDGVFSGENEVFWLERLRFSTTNSSFSWKKTAFYDHKNAVFFQSFLYAFVNSYKTIYCQTLEYSENFHAETLDGKFASHEVKGIENC